MGAKSGYFLTQERSAQFFTVNIQDGAQRNIIASLLLALQFQVFFSITCVQLNLQSGTKVVDTLV